MSPSFSPERDIPSLAGKCILITGGTAGLGAGSVVELARHSPAHIFFSGRNQKAADALTAKVRQQSPDVQLSFIRCDISSLASVRSAAAAFQAQCAEQRLDILMLNAGIMAVDPGVSPDGYETQFATNHLGHALLVKLLLPLLQATAKAHGEARIVNMTSTAYQLAPGNGIDFASLKSDQAGLGGLGSLVPGHKWARYGQSKVAQLLYSEQLARRYPDVTSVSVHPGIILTGLFENVAFSTKLPILIMSIGSRTPVEKGHYNQCWAATCPRDRLVNGEYYEPVGVVGKRASRHARDEKLGERLWDWTEKTLQERQ